VKIGVPKEIKTHEHRVGMTPAGVRELVQHGHQVVVEHAAGIGYDDGAYRKAGATVLDTMAQAPPASPTRDRHRPRRRPAVVGTDE
jgi:alanine dehydrogenase